MLTVEMLRPVFVKATRNFSDDQVPRLAAAFSFYLMLSILPILLFLIVASGLFLDSNAVRSGLMNQIKDSMGADAAGFLGTMLDQAHASKSGGILATVFGLVVALFGASGLAQQLRDSVNAIWNVRSSSTGIFGMILQRLVAFVMVIVSGVVLIGWLYLDARLNYIHKHYSFGSDAYPIWQAISIAISLAFWSGVFACAMRFLPEKKIEWRDVWLAAVLTSVGFTALKYLLSLYFSISSVNATYASAGGLVLLVLWAYYSAQIFFFGVELSDAYAHAFGSLRNEEDAPATAVLPGGIANVRS